MTSRSRHNGRSDLVGPAVVPCAVAACTAGADDPAHVLNVAPADTLPHRVRLCPEHHRAVSGGAEWLARERAGDRNSRGVEVLLGPELAARGLVVPDGPTWSRAGFSPRLAPDRNVGALVVEGRVLGSTDRVHVEVALTPDAVRRLRAVLALYPESEDSPAR